MGSAIYTTSENDLSALASKVNAEHRACSEAIRRSLAHALTAGELLIEAKAQLPHGEWLPWLGGNTEIPERTARLYMRVARHRGELEKTATVADLTLRGAVALLTDAKPEQAGAWEEAVASAQAKGVVERKLTPLPKRERKSRDLALMSSREELKPETVSVSVVESKGTAEPVRVIPFTRRDPETREVEDFERSVWTVVDHCKAAAELVKVPPGLSDERRKELDTELRGAATDVHKLRRRLEGVA